MVKVKINRDLIRERRVVKRLSQEELATLAGITRQFLSEIEVGTKDPSLKTLARIASALNIATTDLYQEYEESTGEEDRHGRTSNDSSGDGECIGVVRADCLRNGLPTENTTPQGTCNGEEGQG